MVGRAFEGKGKEPGQIAYFVSLAVLIGAALAIGHGTAYALVLARYGVKSLPWLYLTSSASLAAFGLIYLVFADRMSAERLFMVALYAIVVILLAIYAISLITDREIVPVIVLVLYETVSEFTLVHLALYFHQNIDSLSQKRLVPLAFAGMQAGIMLGGASLAVSIPLIGLENNIPLWAGLSVAAIFLLKRHHQRVGISPYCHFTGHRQTTARNVIVQIGEGLGYVARSALLRSVAMANFFIVIAIFTMSYTVSRVYADRFPDETTLGEFLGLLILATGATTLVLQFFMTGRLLQQARLKTANQIHPLSMLAAFTLLSAAPALPAAIVGSIAKDVIYPAIGRPARNALLAGISPSVQGRARALMLVLVIPSALAVASLLLVIAYGMSIAALCLVGALATVGIAVFNRLAAASFPDAVRNNLDDQFFVGAAIDPDTPEIARLTHHHIANLYLARQALQPGRHNRAQRRAMHLLRAILDERILQGCEALVADQLVHVKSRERSLICAALGSQDPRHRATAVNLIQQQAPAQLIELMLLLFDDPMAIRNASRVGDVKFEDVDVALTWCCAQNDPWLSQCAGYVRGKLTEGRSDEIFERISLLKETTVFAAVATEALLVIAESMAPERYLAGERVFDINTPSDRFYVIVQGRIGVSVEPDPKARRFINILSEGGTLGEIGCFDNRPRSATAYVLEPTELLGLEKTKLYGLIAHYPTLALGLLRSLGSRLREVTENESPLRAGGCFHEAID